jgi:hypothetical protein
MVETILSVILAITAMAVVVFLSGWVVRLCSPCAHQFERVDDGTERYTVYICTRCGKTKRIKLR